jgi:CBS domain containing-hemolysin-like protein
VTEWLLVAAGVVLTLGTSVFVAAEFAYISLDRSTVEAAAQSGDKASAGVLPALRQLSTQLSASQVGITLTTLMVGYLVEPSVASLLRHPLGDIGLPDGAVDAIAVILALIMATAFSMVVGELVPQYLGLSAPLATARMVTPFMRIFSMITRPLIFILNGSANRFLRSVGVEPQEELSGARTPEELASILLRSAEAGTLDPATAALVTRSLGFADRTAADVMTPRVRCTAIQREESAARIIELSRETGHSRFPVVEDDLDHVLGVVHVKRAISVPHERRDDVPAAALMVDPVVVPESIRLDPLLAQLRGQGLQLAIVVDEYGGTSGVVTLEDVVEELVGEVADEHDRIRTDGRRLRDGSWVVPGLWRPDELRERVGVDVPDDANYETLGGFVMSRLGRVPDVGDEVPVEGGVLRVLRMDTRRIDRLRYLPEASGAATADPATAVVPADAPAPKGIGGTS